jgi:hypothetical protein
MAEILKLAAERRWNLMEWCYKETREPHGWLSDTDIREKKHEMPTVMWETEVELQEPKAEGRLIMTPAVEAMFDAELGIFEGSDGEYIEIEPPVDGARYATGADWARTTDWTVIITIRFDEMPYKVVAFERFHRKPAPFMIERFDKRLDRYQNPEGEILGSHDATGMNILGDYTTHDVDHFKFGSVSRWKLISDYIRAIEHGELTAPEILFMKNEHKYATVEDLSGEGHLKDSMAAGALALHATKLSGGVKTW